MIKNKKAILLIFIILIAFALLLSNYIGLFGGDYGTGLNINTSTQKFTIYGHYDGNGKAFLVTQDYEMLGEVYIASWQTGGLSTTFSADCRFRFRQGDSLGGAFPTFLLGQYAWKVWYINPNNQHTLIIDGENNWINTDIVHMVSGQIMGDLPNMVYKNEANIPAGNANPPANSWGSKTWTWFENEPYPSPWHNNMQTGSISFKIKGNRIGAIRAICIIEFAELYIYLTGMRYIGGNALLVEDNAYLAPGIGKVDVLSAGSIGQNGTVNTIPTNRIVPLYVFEEGSTVKFSVDTGYAGAVSGQKGWRLAVYKSDQTSPLATWWLDDDLRGYEISWTIPQGTYNPSGSNRMRVVLTNTVIDQAETTFFVVDKLNKIPGTPQVTLDKGQYNQGETVSVTLRANANPNGTGEISQFYIEVKWDSPSSTDYVISPKYLPARHVSGLTYEATFSFVVNKPNKYFYVLAWAIDRENRASGRGENYAYVKQVYGNYRITFHVIDENGKPIEGANVTVEDNQPKYTDKDGNATFYLQNKEYSYTVTKDGYKPYSSKVLVNADKVITITMQPIFNILLLVIICIVLIAIVSGAIYYYKKKGGEK